MSTYTATIVVTFDADDEVQATIIGELIRENANKDLEDGDEIYVSQVLPISEAQAPHELVHRIKQVRNDLIRLKKNDCFDVARELDKIAFALTVHDDELATYDYTKFLQTARTIMDGVDIL